MNGHFVDIWYGNIISLENLFDKNLLEKKQDHPYWSLLSGNERNKASNYNYPELQKKYIKMRALLRIILAPYLQIEPQEIIFKTGKHGKPFLDDANIFFNLSHTGNKFVVAVSNLGEVGVDIEKIRDRKNLSALTKKCFSEEENNYWNSLSKAQQGVMFYHFWVRKEAFVKAVGRGIAMGLNECIVNPVEQTYFLSIPDEYGLSSSWRIIEVLIDQDHSCAVVTKNTEFEYKQTEFK